VLVCPEVEIGLGTPREAIHLVAGENGPRLIGNRTGRDHTDAMRESAERRIDQLERLDLSGYVLKSKSPSCALFRIPVYGDNGTPIERGRGVFAEALVRRLPLLPVEDEGRLNDPRLRESFFTRVFGYRRLRDLLRSDWRPSDLIAFHAREKFLLLSHDPESLRELGGLVARAGALDREALAEAYQERFMQALSVAPGRRRQVNVLEHVAGFFRRRVDDEGRRHLCEATEDFRHGLVPLVVPITLIRHFAHSLGPDLPRQPDLPRPTPQGAGAAQPHAGRVTARPLTKTPRRRRR
jgi:uncharacterized protein YbgA (DUF1722 family)/uncharacterized protein YbbK (DUF523 family)